ncbi:MAG: sensor histidine kinase [Betaproteobacteria bacterium]|nr:sensor histidine kinase [Betaproteobacteria bacterium]
MNLPAPADAAPEDESAAPALRALRAALDEARAELADADQRLNRELRERTALAARLALLLDSLPSALVLVSPAGLVCQLSQSAAETTGLVAGASWDSFASRLTPGDIRLRILRSATPAGESIYSLVNVTRVAAERAQLERERQLIGLGQFAAHLAHQLRTPLAAAVLYTGLLQRPVADEAQRAEYLALIADRLRHMQDTIDLTFDHFGTQPASPASPIALVPFMNSVHAAMSGLAARLGVRLRLQLPADCGQMLGWRTALEGALANLVDNALHYSRAGDEVVMDLQSQAERVVLSVTDRGPGMDADTRARVFEPFFTRRQGGTGLGLSIVRGVAERHGGTVVVDSTPGQGATFTLDLPRDPRLASPKGL